MDLTNEEQLKNHPTEIENEEQINHFYIELNQKNKKILELKSRINSLLNSENNLLKEISILKAKNQGANSTEENTNNKENCNINNINNRNNNKNENQLLSLIKNLEEENSLLKVKLNNCKEKENMFNQIINTKLHQAEKELKTLSSININQSNILLALQNFLFNINDKIGNNQELIFDLSIVDNKTFLKNLQTLEKNINNKIIKNNIIKTNQDYLSYRLSRNENKDKLIKNMMKSKVKTSSSNNKNINYLSTITAKHTHGKNINNFLNTFNISKVKKKEKPFSLYNTNNNTINNSLNDDIQEEKNNIKYNNENDKYKLNFNFNCNSRNDLKELENSNDIKYPLSNKNRKFSTITKNILFKPTSNSFRRQKSSKFMQCCNSDNDIKNILQ